MVSPPTPPEPPHPAARSQNAGAPQTQLESTTASTTPVGSHREDKVDKELKEVYGGAMASEDGSKEAVPKKRRRKWTLFDPFNRVKAGPPPESMDDAEIIGLASASFLSQITFWWIQPLLVLGYKRELSATDLPRMDPTRESGHLADLFEANFARRRQIIDDWNASLDNGLYKPSSFQRLRWRINSSLGIGQADGRRSHGLALALSDTFAWEFWSAGLFKIVGDAAQVTSPLVTKEIIHYVTRARDASRGVPGAEMPSIGLGVGLAFGLFGMQLLYSICTAQTFSRGGQTGVLARGALISSIYRKAMVMSGRARVDISNAKLVSHISTDVSRVDFCASFFHFSYTCVFQLLAVIAILLATIGVSSLTGVALIFIAMPLQTYAMKKLFEGRQKSMKFTDQRIKAISELLIGNKIVKLFGWEAPYLAKVHSLRQAELVGIRKLLIIRSANQAIAMSIPVLASVVVFATYAAMGQTQRPAEIWTSLSLLNLLRMPLMLLPNSLSTITDAHSALKRLLPVFLSETLATTFVVDDKLDHAVIVKDASFVWEKSSSSLDSSKGSKRSRRADASITVAEEQTEPSGIYDINLVVPRGQLLCVVGSVGAGKSSLLQGLIGEMRKTQGEVVFGGSLSYCAQTPWAQNATLRDNIIFGLPFDEKRYWDTVRAACLLPDIDMLPQGDMTEIGEKGVTLSGGQRQRVSIARTMYYDADIVLLDDPLSAVDAHVGARLFSDVIMGTLRDKTRILVTHALHVLPQADQIIVLQDGRVTEKGTYTELMSADSTFARLARDFGSGEQTENASDIPVATPTEAIASQPAEGLRQTKALMSVEERATGSVSGSTYASYLRAANGMVTATLLLITLALMAASMVLTNFVLVWWQEDRWGYSSSVYSGLYAAMGIASAIFTFAMGAASVVLGSTAAGNLHHGAINKVLHAPMSFYDTTPVGRVLNRFTKDIDGIDNRLNDSMRMCLATLSTIVGAAIIVSIVSQWLLIAVFGILLLYWWTSSFYRASARSIKRHDNILRSALYAWFSESLAGLATIKAFGVEEPYVKGTEDRIDLENRAYFPTVVNQRWLSIRLDFMGALLTMAVSFVAVGQRTTIPPSQVGLILATILAIQQSLSIVVRQGAEFENNMASVERLVFYQNELEREAPSEIAATAPPAAWPQHGGITFQDVSMSYRPELPDVLRGISFSVRGGERVGVVGRTGAGKSSIMMALFRIVELNAGSILIDGLDISTLGLTTLRKQLSIIPQDPLLFAGTLRSNLDPFGVYDDQVLWDALRRAWLVDRATEPDGSVSTSRFTLDTPIEEEGGLSVGEKSLVSLARALVKDSKVVVLDEATSSVDHSTDSKIQETIKEEFADKTLLVIAHRIRTVISYDRILVLSPHDPQVEALDTPLVLFDQEGTFHSLCVQSGISREDIVAASTHH